MARLLRTVAALAVTTLLGFGCRDDAPRVDPPPPSPPPTAPRDARPDARPDAAAPADAGPAKPDAAPDAAPKAPKIAAPAGGPWPTLPAGPGPALTMVRTATVDGRTIYAARTEVTHDDWFRVVGRVLGRGRTGSARPVVSITAGQAAWFCNMLSVREGLTPCYRPCDPPRDCKRIRPTNRPCDGYRLPTSAEWKRLAREADLKLARARSKAQRPGANVCVVEDGYGLCDLYGGVWEWTETVRKRGRFAVRLGGSWSPDHRDYYNKPMQHAVGLAKGYLGFRPVRVVADPTVTLGPLRLDPVARTLTGPAGTAKLADSDLALLAALAEGGGRIALAGRPPKAIDRFVMAINTAGGFATRAAGTLSMPLPPAPAPDPAP